MRNKIPLKQQQRTRRVASSTSRFTLRKDVKQRWLQMLRSGEYNQGTRSLLNAYNEYCCLGVLCLAMGIRKDVLRNGGMPGDVGVLWSLFPFDDEIQFEVKYKGRMEALSFLNDELQLSFDKLATLIEKQVPCHD